VCEAVDYTYTPRSLSRTRPSCNQELCQACYSTVSTASNHAAAIFNMARCLLVLVLVHSHKSCTNARRCPKLTINRLHSYCDYPSMTCPPQIWARFRARLNVVSMFSCFCTIILSATGCDNQGTIFFYSAAALANASFTCPGSRYFKKPEYIIKSLAFCCRSSLMNRRVPSLPPN